MLLSFFLQYISLYPLTILQPQIIHIYCDNSGVIAWINGHPSVLQPQDIFMMIILFLQHSIVMCNCYTLTTLHSIMSKVTRTGRRINPYQYKNG